MSENLKEWIKDILVAIVIAVIILQFIKPTIVREHAMENTLHQNDYLFVSKQHYKLLGREPKLGDIIVFQSELENNFGGNKLLIKRVIAVPGDTIAIHDGYVVLNGTTIMEPYTKDTYTATEMDEITVPEGQLFCMGDNRQNSADSRDSRIGLVDQDTIMGKAVFRLFPFSEIGNIYKNYVYMPLD